MNYPKLITLALCFLGLATARSQTIGHDLNNPGKNFSPSGNANWISDGVVHNDSVSAARSGGIGNSQSSGIVTTFNGPGTLRFWWKVGSEPNFDFLELFVDGIRVNFISGNINWAQVTHPIPTGGVHTVEWRYKKDISLTQFPDAGWVDQVAFVPLAGDAEHHIDARVGQAFISSSTLVFNDPDENLASFRGRAFLYFQQLDEAALPPTQTTLPVRVTWTAENATTGTPVSTGTYDTSVTLASHSGGADPLPGTASLVADFNFIAWDSNAPNGHLSVDPLTSYRLRVTAHFTDPSANVQPVTGEMLTGNSRLLTLSGNLTAGGVAAKFRQISWSPSLTGSEPPGHLIDVDSAADAVWLASDPTVRFRLFFNTVYRTPSGDLELRPGIPITLPDFTRTVAGVRTRGKNVTLSSTGFRAGEYRIYFPAGFGVMAPTPAHLLEKTSSGFAVLENLALGPELIPPAPVPITPLTVRRAVVPDVVQANVGNLLYCSHERLPCWFLAISLTFHPDNGSFSTVAAFDAPWLHVRAVEKVVMDSIVPAPGQAKDFRPSNDGYYSRTWALGAPATSSFSISTNEQGIALLNAECPLGPATHEPHWPQGVVPAPAPAVPGFTFTGGTVTFANNEIVPAASGLTGVNTIVQRYARDPVETSTCANGAGQGTFDFVPAGQQVAFTPDGGLLAAGNLAIPKNLAWGTVDQVGGSHRFAHASADPFTGGTFYQPGYFLAGDLSAASNDDRPGTLLLTGRGDPGSPLTERPVADDPGYFNNGVANYPGLNLRASPGQRGESTLAGMTFGPYPLAASSRYSVHRGGVCGVHERITTVSPVALNLFGFNATLKFFKLGWLDSVNESSVCEGGLVVPYPSGFTQLFEDLRFDQRGMPSAAGLPANSPSLALQYWGNQSFTPLSFSFQPTRSDNPCLPPPNSSSGFLEMAVRFPSLANSFIPGPIHGTLGFKSNGDLITAEDRRSGLAKGSTVDSRLILPPQLTIAAPGGGSYRLQPITRGYFNAYPGGGGNEGFISFAGKLGVPFFEAMPVHVHVVPVQGSSGIHLMNGWEENGRHFFNDGDRFDATHRGTPPLVAVGAYRSPLPENENRYLPRARKNWLDTIDFNYPLAWDPGLQKFQSPRPVTEDVVLFNLTHQCGYLTASGAEIKFGAEIAELPAINPQKLLVGVLDNLPGNAFNQFDAAIDAALGAAADASQLTKAFSSMDAMLSDRLADTLRAPAGGILGFVSLEDSLNQAIGDFLPDVPAEGINGLQYKDDLIQIITNTGSTALTAPLTRALGPDGLVKLANQRFDQTLSGLRLVRDLVSINEATNQRQAFRTIVRELGRTNNAVFDAIISQGAANGMTWLESEMQRLEFTPYLGEIKTTLDQLINQVSALKTQFNPTITTPASSLLNSDFNTTLQIAVRAELDRLLPNSARLTPGDTAQINQIRTRLRAVLSDGFYASPAARQLSSLLRQNLNGPRTVFRSVLDDLLGQVRDSIKNAVIESGSQALGNLPEFKELRSASDQLSKSFGGANLRGYARTVGNSISTVRLDGSLKLAPPGADLGIEATGYVEYKDYELLGPEPDCLQVGSGRSTKIAVAAGIRTGASGKAKGPTPPGDINQRGSSFDGMAVGVDVAFALNRDGVPVGFGGKMFFQGQANFGLVTVQKIELTANFSESNQYVIGLADGQVLQILDVKAQIFAGNTCDFNRLGLLDEYTTRSLDELGYPAANRQRMAGIVFKALGGISLNEILPIPKKIIDIYLERGYTMLLLVAADGNTGEPIFNNPNFLLGASEYGRASVRLFEKVKVADVALGYGGVIKLPPDPGRILQLVMNVNGGADFCGPCLDLGITELCLPCVGFRIQGEIRPLPAPPFAAFYLTGLSLK